MKRIHIVGRKNSGKTTLIVELVAEFSRRGYRVGTIKHTHHEHELDTPGKDSHRHRTAGSAAVGLVSHGMNAIFWPPDVPQSANNKYAQFDAMMNDCDVVFVEGDSQTRGTKIEVHRAKNGPNVSPLSADNHTIHAVITDDPTTVETPVWKRRDLDNIVANLESLLNCRRQRTSKGLSS